mmetsp:Transcript_43154/g.85083  ORF Transcript_43154/g.85083 Transcript_43154/m.85083 type:complete len:104 (-) Transcript_43154:1548-1859(-)
MRMQTKHPSSDAFTLFYCTTSLQIMSSVHLPLLRPTGCMHTKKLRLQDARMHGNMAGETSESCRQTHAHTYTQTCRASAKTNRHKGMQKRNGHTGAQHALTDG